jgi:hypothetical protein
MSKRIEVEIPILGRVSVNFEELSSKLYDVYLKYEEVERQKKSPHLGLISKVFSGVNHSRFEYLILQCVISELVENNYKGTTNAQGSIKINSVNYSGNDIIKTWFLMSNFGHCKNTIGDEKAILLKVIQQKKFKSYIVNSIKDLDLKIWSEWVINNFDYVNFHHILSIRRIYKTLSRNKILQDELIRAYKLLLLRVDQTREIANSLKVEQLRITYNNIRDLSILALDPRNTSLPFTVDILSTVLSINFFENRYEQSKISDIFKPMLSLLYDNLYLHPRSQTIQRSYEIQSLKNMSVDYGKVIDNAILDGLSNPDEIILDHFLRIELHSDFSENLDKKEALRNLLTVRREINSVHASLDYNPISSKRVFDFYVERGVFKIDQLPKFLNNITLILEKQFSGTVKNYFDQKSDFLKILNLGMLKSGVEAKSKEIIISLLEEYSNNESFKLVQSNNIPKFKGILWSVLNFFIKEQYSFDIEYHTSSSFEYLGVRFINGIDLLNNQIESAIQDTSELDRKHELKQLKRSTSRKFLGTTIACLSRVTIYDYSKAPNSRIVTDIDSIVLKYNDQKMILELHESKNTRNPYNTAKKDLKNKLIKVLNQNSKGYLIKEVKGFGAKVVIQCS